MLVILPSLFSYRWYFSLKINNIAYSAGVNEPHSELPPIKTCAVTQLLSLTLLGVRIMDIICEPIIEHFNNISAVVGPSDFLLSGLCIIMVYVLFE